MAKAGLPGLPSARAAAIALLVATQPLHAQPRGASAYVTDQGGEVVRNAAYLCWHTGYWSPAAAIAECDPDLVPKSAAAAPAPAPAPPAVQSAPAKVSSPAAKPPTPTVAPAQIRKITLSAETLFDFDKSALKPEGRRKIEELAVNTTSLDLDTVVAVGHTDSVGQDAYNRRLSMRRAQAVRSYLLSKGIASRRVTAQGRGETQPVASNSTAEGRARNRRVELEVIGNKR